MTNVAFVADIAPVELVCVMGASPANSVTAPGLDNNPSGFIPRELINMSVSEVILLYGPEE